MDSRVIQIADRGAFKGSAEIDIAEIHGVFDGTLTARQKLVIYSTGKVTGKIRYGKVVIEEGGQLSGEIQAAAVPAAAPRATPRPRCATTPSRPDATPAAAGHQPRTAWWPPAQAFDQRRAAAGARSFAPLMT